MHSILPRPLLVAALLLVIGALVGCQGAPPVAQPAAPAPVNTTAPVPVATDTPASEAGAAMTPLATGEAGDAMTPLATSEAGAVMTPLATGEAGAAMTPLATDALTSPLGTPAAMAPAATSMASAAGTPSTLPVLGGGINSVTYIATDTGYSGPASFASGWTQLTLTNQGTTLHDLQFIELQAGKTISDVLSVLQSQGGPPDWIKFYGSVRAAPGQSAAYVVNTPAGNYVILSFAQSGPNQPPDALLGLLSAITVTAPQAGAPQPVLPTTSASINLVDFSFVVTGTFQAGDQTVLLTNSGKEDHQAVFLPLKPGKTVDDFNKALRSEMSGTPVPEPELLFGKGPSVTLSPGVSLYFPVTLQAGEYALACFIPSPANGGQPHAVLGMVKQVTVRVDQHRAAHIDGAAVDRGRVADELAVYDGQRTVVPDRSAMRTQRLVVGEERGRDRDGATVADRAALRV